MAKMKAFVAASKKAQPKLTKIDIPQIADNEVLVEVAAASINPVDQLYRLMQIGMQIRTEYPFTLGNDFSGTIVAKGKNVNKYQLGDQVYGRIKETNSGTFAEYVAIESQYIALIPQNISLIEAASIPLVGLTAYQALFDRLNLQTGQKIFINAGSGGVGSLAIQLAKAKGAYVATTISPKNKKLVQSLGADEIIDYHQTDFSEVLHDYDAVFDTHGKGDTTKALQILKSGGKLVTIAGVPTTKLAKERNLNFFRKLVIKLISLSMVKKARLHKVSYQFLLMNPDGNQLQKLTKLIEDNKVKPIIDRTFEFDQIETALKYSDQGHNVGKVILTMKKD